MNKENKKDKLRIYLDVCCLNRPFDNQVQDRVRLEAEAVLAILKIEKNEKSDTF
jgi:hypothetical protein